MKLDRFSPIHPEEHGPLLDALRGGLKQHLTGVIPGLRVVETDFAVPGRGVQAAMAVDAGGRCVLVEFYREKVTRISDDLLARIAWFEENRSLLPRLFPDSGMNPTSTPGVLLLAPAFSESVRRTATGTRLADIQLLRIQFLGTETSRGFFLEDPVFPDRVSPLTESESRRPVRSIASFHPIRAVNPEELLARSRHWFSKLSPDIRTRTEGESVSFTYCGQVLATMTPANDALCIEVPRHGTTLVHDMHELNQGMNSVIHRYFGLVDPGSSSSPPLRIEDILTEGELSEFLDSNPEKPD